MAARRPNVAGIYVRNYVFNGSNIAQRLDDYPAPCIISASNWPGSQQATHVGFQPLGAGFALAVSLQEAQKLAAIQGLSGLQFPLYMRRISGLYLAVIGQNPGTNFLVSVIATGEQEEELP